MLVETPFVEVLQLIDIPALIEIPPGDIDKVEPNLIVSVCQVVCHNARPVRVFPLKPLLQSSGKSYGALLTGGPLRSSRTGSYKKNLVHISPSNH